MVDLIYKVAKPVSSGCDRLGVSSCCPRERAFGEGFSRGFCSCLSQDDDEVGDCSQLYEFSTGGGNNTRTWKAPY